MSEVCRGTVRMVLISTPMCRDGWIYEMFQEFARREQERQQELAEEDTILEQCSQDTVMEHE